jgi:antitoxin MazE
MQTTISKWGNSLGLRLPRHIAEATQLVEGASVKLEIEDGAIKVTPTRRRFKLSELLEGETPRAEYDWGKPKGDEEW